jgi:hypothetical protein
MSFGSHESSSRDRLKYLSRLSTGGKCSRPPGKGGSCIWRELTDVNTNKPFAKIIFTFKNEASILGEDACFRFHIKMTPLLWLFAISMTGSTR